MKIEKVGQIRELLLKQVKSEEDLNKLLIILLENKVIKRIATRCINSELLRMYLR